MTKKQREAMALMSLKDGGIEPESIYSPESGDRRWVFHRLPPIRKLRDLELVAAFVERVNEINFDRTEAG